MTNRRASGLTALLSLAGVCVVSPSLGQSTGQDGEFSVQRFEPAPGPKNYLTMAGARMEAPLGFSAGLFLNYSRDPFVVVSCTSEDNCDSPGATDVVEVPVVQDMFNWDLLGSINPTDWMQVGLRLPLSYVSGQSLDFDTGTPGDTVSGFGMGDPNVEGKVRFFGDPAKDPIVLGAAVDFSFPLGTATAENRFIGNDNPVTIGWRGIVDGRLDAFFFGGNLRGVFRGENRVANTEVGPVEFRYAVGAGYDISPVLAVLVEGYGGTQFSSENGTNSLEIDGAVRVSPLDTGLAFTLGGGAGIIDGVGVPVARVLGGVMYAHQSGDADQDGISDMADECPTVAEDRDGFDDEDGCRDDDNDGDRIPDAADKCPLEPETINGTLDEDGCPDERKDSDKDGVPDDKDVCPDTPGRIRTEEFLGCADSDSDGVPDPKDECVDEAEDTDGHDDLDGCPDPDNDGDGIPDLQDECSDVPEIMNGIDDEDGCPDKAPDADGDGIADNVDKCPTRAETLNGINDEDGCPEGGPALVEVQANEIKIKQRVEFDSGSDAIQGQPSFSVLAAVAGAMKNNPLIAKVEVAGHTDNVGLADQNKELSQKRAEAVVAYLVEQGVAAARLVAKGYGQEAPVGDNATPAGQKLNRRVEFKILEQHQPKN